MTKEELFQQIKIKKSFLCVGLDTDPSRIPKHLLSEPDPVFSFNKAIVEATSDLCVSYKPNIAFYEAQGPAGWESLRKSIEIIPEECFTIADAKRGDIGNTSAQYAKTFFETYDFDSITIAPYMGADSVTPFLTYKGKWGIILALTSNPSAADFQYVSDGMPLYKHVLEISKSWGNDENLMYVIGATKAEMLNDIRKIVPDHFLLVPGVGAQGGSLEEVAQHGMNDVCGLLVNSSRGIIFASSGEDFAEKARDAAIKLQQEMSILLDKYLG